MVYNLEVLLLYNITRIKSMHYMLRGVVMRIRIDPDPDPQNLMNADPDPNP